MYLILWARKPLAPKQTKHPSTWAHKARKYINRVIKWTQKKCEITSMSKLSPVKDVILASFNVLLTIKQIFIRQQQKGFSPRID